MSFNFLNPKFILTQLKITDFFKYIDFMESSIISHKSRLIKTFEEASKSITNPEHRQEYFEIQYLDDYQDLDLSYTLILRKSLFITLYSFLESELLKITKRLENSKRSNIKLNDLRHRGIRRYLFYIEVVHHIKFTLSNKDRNEFFKYNRLRNHVVHSDGISLTYAQYNKVKSLPHIKFVNHSKEDNHRYDIDRFEKEFNITFLNLISNFFKQLFLALEENESTSKF